MKSAVVLLFITASASALPQIGLGNSATGLAEGAVMEGESFGPQGVSRITSTSARAGGTAGPGTTSSNSAQASNVRSGGVSQSQTSANSDQSGLGGGLLNPGFGGIGGVAPFNTGLNQFGTGFDQFGTGFNQFGNGFNQFGNGFNQFGNGFGQFGNGLGQFRRGFGGRAFNGGFGGQQFGSGFLPGVNGFSQLRINGIRRGGFGGVNF